ncbi:uncharacterized protein [Watersipora subatra]|uniref:uncharacterized protein n=1 Tax=Watersipora subatra TaxID=2589382 RepID=UPI00355BE6AA
MVVGPGLRNITDGLATSKNADYREARWTETKSGHVPITESRKSAGQTLPAFTVPDEQAVVNSNELQIEDNNQQVPGYQIDLRSHNLSHRDDSESEENEYRGYHKRLKLDSPKDSSTQNFPHNGEEVKDSPPERLSLSEDESSFSFQSSHMDSFSLENMLSDVSESSSFHKDSELSSSQSANLSDTSLPDNSSCHEVIDLRGHVAAARTLPAANNSDDEVQHCGSNTTITQVPADGIIDLRDLQDSNFSFTNSLSPLLSSQRTSPDDIEQVSSSFLSDLSFDESEQLHSHSLSSDQQVPLSSEDEIELALARRHAERRQLQSCGAQVVPDRDIEE